MIINDATPKTINKYCELTSDNRVITYCYRSICNENPTMQEDGTVSWNNIHSTGKTAKLMTVRAFNKLRREGRQAKNDLRK